MVPFHLRKRVVNCLTLELFFIVTNGFLQEGIFGRTKDNRSLFSTMGYSFYCSFFCFLWKILGESKSRLPLIFAGSIA